MSLLLCAATDFEIQPTVDMIRNEHLDVDVLITGVGMLAATYSIASTVIRKRPDFILQAGVAGCLDLSLPLTKIVIIESEVIGDLGVEEQGVFRSVASLQLLGANDEPWKEGRLTNSLEALKKAGLTAVNGVTVNEISTDPKRIAYYRDELGAAVESMEGAALHYVGLKEKIPFLQLRSLSNFVGERDKSKWVMKMAIERLNIELGRILQQMQGRRA